MKNFFCRVSATIMLAFLFFSCTPQTPLILYPTTIDLEVGKEVDLSAFAGRNAFLIVTNNNDEITKVFNSNSSNINTIDTKFDKVSKDFTSDSKNKITNIPFEAPKIDIQPVIDNSISDGRSLNATEATVTYEIGNQRSIYGANNNNSQVLYGNNATLKVIGEHCYVWYLEKSGITVTDAQLEKLANTFDSIYEKETYLFGNNYDSNCNYSNLINLKTEQKVHLFVYDLYNDYVEYQNSGTFGYFWSYDFYKNGTYGSNTTSNSNECQCLHLDSYFTQVVEDYMVSTVAHEFQHLLHYVNKTIKHASSTDSDSFRYADTWFDEMMSMVCEDIMQSQLGIDDDASPKSRLSTFNNSYMYGFTAWLEDDYVFISYANAYAFGAYLVRNFGIDFIKELAQNDYINQEAITKALQAKNCSLTTFDQAYENFYNTVLFPIGTSYTLFRTARESYEIGKKTVTFECSPINLFDYPAITAQNMTSSTARKYFNGVENTDYYGPVILNAQYYYSNLYPHGMSVSYWGQIGSNILPSKYTLSSSFATANSGVKYRLYIGY